MPRPELLQQIQGGPKNSSELVHDLMPISEILSCSFKGICNILIASKRQVHGGLLLEMHFHWEDIKKMY